VDGVFERGRLAHTPLPVDEHLCGRLLEDADKRAKLLVAVGKEWGSNRPMNPERVPPGGAHRGRGH
jgi:hypothetical protein